MAAVLQRLAHAVEDVRRRRSFTLAATAVRRALAERSARMAAAFTYYAALSLAPLLVAAIAIAGFLLGEEAARARLLDDLARVTDPQIAMFADRLLETSRIDEGRWWKIAFGLGVAMWSASRVFVLLQDALNGVWGVRLRTGDDWREMLRARARKRGWSFAWVLAIGLLVVASFVAQTTVLPVLRALGRLPMATPVADLIALAGTVAVVALFLWVAYRNLPDVELGWRETLPGSVVAALGIVAGGRALTYYFAHFAAGSVTAAAGGLFVVLIWIYVAARVILLGGEIDRAWVEHRRGRAAPEPHAEWVPEGAEEAGW